MEQKSHVTLLFEHRSGHPAERHADSAEVSEINRRTALMASQWIFTGEASPGLAALLDSVRGKQAGFSYEEVPTRKGLGHLQLYVGIGPATLDAQR